MLYSSKIVKLRICWLGALLLLVLLGGSARAATPWPPVLVLHDTAQAYPVGRYWALLADPRPLATVEAHRLTLAQVRADSMANRFVPSQEDVPNRHRDNTDYWLRCRVQNTARTGVAWLLTGVSVGRPFEVFAVAADGSTRHYLNLNGQWQEPRAVPSRFYNLGLNLKPGETYTIYLHSWSDLFKYTFFERAHFIQFSREGDVATYLYFGLLLGLIAYNLLLYFSVRDRGYLYYVLFTASFGLIQFDMMGYRRQYLPWVDDLVPFGFQELVLSAILVFSVLTARQFLETTTGQTPRYLDRLLRATLLIALLPAGVSLAAYYWLLPAAWGLVLTISPLTVGGILFFAGMRQLVHGYRPARYYMAGWGLLIAAVALYYMRSLGIIPVSFLTEQGVRIASACEVILLSLGLADRINRARQERAAAQQAALTALGEKEEVQRDANDALRQRADELQRAYADLRTSIETTDRLQEVDELKTRFFTGISHELRTPLTLILGPLEQVMRQPAAAPLAAEHQLMHRHGQRLLMLINQLLDIARLEAGQMQLQACPTDLTAFTQTLVEAFASSAATKNVRLSALLPPTALSAYVDRDQLEKVLTNLLSNALKFTEAEGSITAALYTEGAEAVLTVTDTGCGIAASHLPKVFDRFYQADGSTRRRHDGSGIGLALVKELVALHHGAVEVRSTEGVGSAFTVRLPLGMAHLKPEEIIPVPLVNEESLSLNEELRMKNEELAGDNSSFLIPHSSLSDSEDNRPLILVVDDHADMRAYVVASLGQEFRVMQAPDGHTALVLIQANLPDLILTDLMMPVMDGLELCRRFKTDEHTSHIPVVMLTARASDESRLEGLELGADDYLIKPFRPAELRARVQNLILQRRRLRERFSREVTLQPRDISITPADEVFLNRALAVVEAHLADADFDVETFASALAMSRVQLFRKLKALTDQAPTDFVRLLRLRRAAQLLTAQAGTVADVAYAVGFNSLSYFSKCFREVHGHAPSEHVATQSQVV